MNELASAFIGEDSIPRACEYFAKPAKVGLPSPTHQDNAYWCVNTANALTIWIALDHASQENGAVGYYPCSHKLGLLRHKPSFAPGSSQMVADEELVERLQSERVVPTLEPGDILVHHCLTVHDSGPNRTSQPRRGLTLQYRAKSSEYDKKMIALYEDNLAEQIRIRGAQ
jgi:ectoine hydroxylase-related dioxygenase (phytanoyl-CoA dioxygenase family)